MPMIDVYAPKGLFADKAKLLQDLNDTLMRWENVPPIALFKDNTAAYLHELESGSFANASGESRHVRIQVLTPSGILDRDKKLGVTKDMTQLIAVAAGDGSLAERVWIQIVEAPDGGWGIGGHAFTNQEIAAEARRILSAS